MSVVPSQLSLSSARLRLRLRFAVLPVLLGGCTWLLAFALDPPSPEEHASWPVWDEYFRARRLPAHIYPYAYGLLVGGLCWLAVFAWLRFSRPPRQFTHKA